MRRNFQVRETKGEFHMLVKLKDFRLFDKEYFFRNLRMDLELIPSWVAPHIQKSSKRRPTVTPTERLCVALCYLTAGDAQFTIASSYMLLQS